MKDQEQTKETPKENSQALAIPTQEELFKKEIEKYNLPRQKIAELKTEYAALATIEVGDKEGYKKLVAAIGTVRPLRTGVEKKRKELNEFAKAYKSAVDTEAEELTTLLEEVEDPLQKRKKFIDDELLRIKNEEIQKAEALVNERIHSLINAGCSFTGTHYEIGEGESLQRVSVVDVRNTSDESFAVLKKNIEDVAEAIKQKVIAEQERQKAESERLKKEQEQFELDKAQLEKEKAELEKAKQEQLEKEQAIAKQLYATRTKQLQALGYLPNPQQKAFSFTTECGVASILDLEITTLGVDEWNEKFKYATDERVRLYDLQVAKDAKDKADKEAADAKALADKEAKEKADKEAAELLRKQQLPDIEKCQEFFTSVSNALENQPELTQLEVSQAFQHTYNLITGAITQFNQKFPVNETN